MASTTASRRFQFSLRGLLGTLTWMGLLVAVCVGQQRAAVKQRETIRQLKAAGILPMTMVNGRPAANQPTVTRH